MDDIRRLRYLAVIIIILMPLTIAGCWGRRETQQMNLATALGFDKIVEDGKSRYRLTVLSTKPAQSAGGAGGGINAPQKNYTNLVFSNTGETVWDAGRNWNLRSSRQLFLGQVIVVVIGEETAREDLAEIIDFLMRHQDIRERVWMVVCKGSAADFLNSRPEEETIASVEMDGILRNGWTRTGKTKGMDLFNFSYALLTPGLEAVLPYMELFEPPEPGSSIKQSSSANASGLESQGGSDVEPSNQPQKKSFIAKGFAVFRGNKMVGVMNEEESQGLLYLTGQVKTAALPIDVGDNNKNVALRIEDEKTKVKAVFSEGKILFKVTVQASGDLMEESGDVINITPKDWNMIEEMGAREIERRCRAAAAKSQELKTDVLGLGNKIHRSSPREWKEIQASWEEIFPGVTVDIKAELKVKQTGVASDPITVK